MTAPQWAYRMFKLKERLGSYRAGGGSYEQFMRDFASAATPQDRVRLNQIANQPERHDGLLRCGAQLWRTLGYRRGATLLELGPGHGLLSLKAALNGLAVTVIEHPACPFLSFLQHHAQLLASAIDKAGGHFEIILGDVLDEAHRHDILCRLGARSFDHFVAMDVFCAANQTPQEIESTLRRFSWARESTSAYYGIHDANAERSVLDMLLRFKAKDRGTIYVNHTYSLGRAMEDVMKGRFHRISPFRRVPGLAAHAACRALCIDGQKSPAVRHVASLRLSVSTCDIRTGPFRWLYLAAVMDLHSRQVVGWSLQPHMAATLVRDALLMACFRRRPEPGLILHSDRGSQGGFNWSSQHL
jgi:hypothetical protein